jgi:hypothetical protein
MRLGKLAMLAAIACGIHAGNAEAQENIYSGVVPVSHSQQTACDCGEPVCGCEPVLGLGADGCAGAGCDGLCDGGCDSACGLGSRLGLGGLGLGDCNLGDPFTLFGECGAWSAGGWIQMGHHNKNIPLFNKHRSNFNLHQAWLYAEKSIDTSAGFDIGGRIDYVYGVDAQDTQAFGTDPNGWDNPWDQGIYGHALPQLYAEAGYGDLSVKVGHFYTLIGYEVVPAPDNFFYSHAYTMYNSEPFTHTGALATYQVSDDITAYGGYVLGWDSGFDDNGDSYIGGASLDLTENATLTYMSVMGRFGEGSTNVGGATVNERGFMNSVVLDVALTDNLQYVFQNDYLDTEDETGATFRETWDINQYLIYNINDCLAVGGRYEWYQQEGVYSPIGQDDEVTAFTMGLNYRPHANVVVRPEVRWDHDKSNAQLVGLEDGGSQTTFGFDTIFTF